MIRVYYKVGATKSFQNANSWHVTEDWGLQIVKDDPEEDSAIIAAVPPGVWETVVDVDLQDAEFPSPPKPFDPGVVIPHESA